MFATPSPTRCRGDAHGDGMMKRSSHIASIALILGLGGCVVGPRVRTPRRTERHKFHRHTDSSHIGVTTTADAQRLLFGQAPASQWWRMFHLELDRLVQRALDENRTLDAASAALAEAQELLAARGVRAIRK